MIIAKKSGLVKHQFGKKTNFRAEKCAAVSMGRRRAEDFAEKARKMYEKAIDKGADLWLNVSRFLV